MFFIHETMPYQYCKSQGLILFLGERRWKAVSGEKDLYSQVYCFNQFIDPLGEALIHS